MNFELDGFKKFLGKHVVDNYGRALGRVVGFISNVNRQVTDVEIEFGNGEFVRCPSKQLMMEAGTLTYLYPWEMEALEIANALDLVIKRIQALDDLLRMGEIPSETYEEFKKVHEASFIELKDRRARLISRLESRVDKLRGQIRELQMFRTSLKMQRATGEIEEDVFKDVIPVVEEGLNRSFKEKEELERTIDRLSKLDLKRSSPLAKAKAVISEPAPAKQERAEEKSGDSPINVKVED